jgi:hypothetical protein
MQPTMTREWEKLCFRKSPLSTKTHGNHWPVEWTNRTLPTWEDERCTRKGEGMPDYVHDPKFRKGRDEPHVVHCIE